MNYRWLCLITLLPGVSLAQSTYAPLNEDYYHWIDRYEIKAGRVAPELFTSVKPYARGPLVAFIDSLNAKDGVFTSRSDLFNYDYLRNDSWEWSRAESNTSRRTLFKKLYRAKSDFGHVDIPDFDVHVNPVLYFGLGSDSRLSESPFINTRGIEIRGMIDRKIGFYTYLTDNQAILPAYVQDQMSLNPVVPHETFWKRFKTNGVDFFQARAYITFNVTRHIAMQFGQDRTFIGNGLRSLIFSDNAPPNLFLRANVKVWKINYLFQINRMTADAYGGPGGSQSSQGYPEKYMAFHHASVNIGKKFNLGLFESVVFNAKDTLSGSSFNLSYLNPVIFYRAIEQQAGSPDNVIVGADFKWNVFKGISFYGQVVIDEFLLKEVMAGNGWWANKFAGQLGIKLIDFAGIHNLDLQLEGNVARPYTYSHSRLYDNYSTYRQPVAHPLGANFAEAIGLLRYQPLPRLNITGKAFYVLIGRDTTGVNWGSDILKNNLTRQHEHQNKIGQGIRNTIAFGDLTISYQLKHNLFIEVKQVIRISRSAVPVYNNNTSLTSLALRLNIARRSYDF